MLTANGCKGSAAAAKQFNTGAAAIGQKQPFNLKVMSDDLVIRMQLTSCSEVY